MEALSQCRYSYRSVLAKRVQDSDLQRRCNGADSTLHPMPHDVLVKSNTNNVGDALGGGYLAHDQISAAPRHQ